jgi:hypothetical protein
MWPNSAIFQKKITKANNRPLGENSHNLVTLLGSKKGSRTI